MKKSELSYGMKVRCKKTGLVVEVVDLGNNRVLFGNDTVGITDGASVAKYVHIDELEALPVEAPEVKQGACACGCNNEPSTKPVIKMRYDFDTNSLFILINDKTTICIPGVKPEIVNAIGVSSCNDTDTYNAEIGDALAFFRSAKNEGQAEAEADGFFDFLESLVEQDKEFEEQARKDN